MPRKPRYLTHTGETLPLAEWAKRARIHIETLRSRLDHQGMTLTQAISRPVEIKFNPRRKKVASKMPRACPEAKKHTDGRAYVRWCIGGRRSFRSFGPWGSAEAVEGYRRFQVEWAAGLSTQASPQEGGLTVAALVVRYLGHVRSYYVKEGKPTSEQAGQKAAMRFLLAHCGKLLVTDMKGRHLEECQHAMIDAKFARTTINQHTWRITRCFRWGVGKDLVPPDVAAVLESVPNLQPVASVPVADIEQIIPYLHAIPARKRVLEAMIRFMLLVGCRPSELCGMRVDTIDRTGEVWFCRVSGHKNLHRQAKRRPKVVWIGPKAQAILAPFLADPGAGGEVWVFPPKGKGTKRTPIRRPAFAEFIRLACKKAEVKSWHPHQLRHNRATEVYRLYEDNAAAAAIIGDTPSVAANVYIDPSEAIARRIAKATG